MRRTRVLIVEDSPVVREHLRRIISADSRLEVAGIAATGEEALKLLDQLSPDVISMDIQLPGISGLETTRLTMAHRPTPIVVVSGMGSGEMNLTMQALKAGALSVVKKPVAASHGDYEALAGQLCTQLSIMSEVKVVKQRRMGAGLAAGDRRSAVYGSRRYRILGIAASTGGPNALVQVLSGLGADFSVPIALVQHMTPGFVSGFASWLASMTPLPVEIVERPTPLRPGRVYLAPEDRHLAVDGRSAWLEDGPAVGSHRPSADVLFSSMACGAGPAAIGVLLTGMGEDGAAGLRELRATGGLTIAEDESTAVVYGMPAAGVRLGAVCESLPLGEVAPRVLELVASGAEALS
jgi:two-component system chemotaxis response regulator CheB